MQENMQTQSSIGYLGGKIPIRQGEEISEKEAESMSNEINNAYNFIINYHGDVYSKIVEKINEIQIVNSIKTNYDLMFSDADKAILRIKNNISYTEIIHCIIVAGTELSKI